MTAAAAFGQVLLCLVSARWRELRLNAEGAHPLPEGMTATQTALLQALQGMRLASSPESPCVPAECSDQADDIRLGLLMAAEQLHVACRLLLVDRGMEARARLENWLQTLLSLGRRAGLELSVQECDHLRGQLVRLPALLDSQLALQRAVDFGGLSNRIVLVLGMHRSGTSALTGMLASSGLDVPGDLMDRPDDVINRKGYWESEGLMQLNDQLFSSLGRHWSSADQLPSGWADCEAAAVWRRSLISQWQQSCRGLSHPVIKDPRLCVLAEGLRPLLQSDAVRFTVFLPIRHPLEAARSLQAAQGTDLLRGLQLWIAHVLEAERWSRDLPRQIIAFEDLLQQPEAVLVQCRHRLGQETVQEQDQASSFIDPALRRQTARHREEALDAEERVWLESALRIQRRLLQPEADDPLLQRDLDGLRPAGGRPG